MLAAHWWLPVELPPRDERRRSLPSRDALSGLVFEQGSEPAFGGVQRSHPDAYEIQLLSRSPWAP